MSGVVIVGASHAGTRAAAALRQMGWQEKITLLSNEEALPYHRPPLSKAFLAGVEGEEQLLLRGEKFYADEGIELIRGASADLIHPDRRVVSCAGSEIEYDKLIVATGASARRLVTPGADLNGVHVLRNMNDARYLKAELERASNIVIVGGGFIGLEVAATAIKAGKHVVVLEAQDRLLARALPPLLSMWLQRVHADHGVNFRFAAEIDHFGGDRGLLSYVSLASGEKIPADMVLVGIGSAANSGLAEAAGLELAAGGIRVNAQCQTSIPDIYAIGDCAAQYNLHSNSVIRVESVQNATDQARVAAAHICGQAIPPVGVNWFWTDQYDLKIQFAGLARTDCQDILRGQPDAGGFSLLQADEGRLAWAFSVNRAPDHMAARKLIASGAPLDLARAADPGVPLTQTVLAASQDMAPATGG
jgi:3-phenylpropionate/trans-cinnamate dioxygenase ferredoxin reductase subunit